MSPRKRAKGKGKKEGKSCHLSRWHLLDTWPGQSFSGSAIEAEALCPFAFGFAESTGPEALH